MADANDVEEVFKGQEETKEERYGAMGKTGENTGGD